MRANGSDGSSPNGTFAAWPNDTKWDELIDEMRTRTGWRPRYRCKRIDESPWRWDGEWFYHLPFPLLSVEWLDLEYLDEIREHRQPPRVLLIDHSDWIEELLRPE